VQRVSWGQEIEGNIGGGRLTGAARERTWGGEEEERGSRVK